MMKINCKFEELRSCDKKVYIVIMDKYTKIEMKSYGEWCGISGDKIDLAFKTADNESQVKEVEVNKNGEWRIKSMMRNRPIPSSYSLIEVGVVDRYTPEEKEKIDLRTEIHNILDSRCNECVSFSKPITLNLESIGRTINMEYFTKDWFGCDDIINYQTDHIRTSCLSANDLRTVKSAL